MENRERPTVRRTVVDVMENVTDGIRLAAEIAVPIFGVVAGVKVGLAMAFWVADQLSGRPRY